MSQDWITRAEASRILDCSPTQVGRYIDRGLLARRSSEPRSGRLPSLGRAQVLELRERLIEELAELERERTARERERAIRRQNRGAMPPDLEHEWLTAEQAGKVIGISRPGISQRVRRGTIPYSLSDGRRWFRRDLIEQLGRARKARLTGELDVDVSE